MPKTIRQAVTFRAAPRRLFDIYLSSREQSAATGANVPDANAASITRGWSEYYWKPLRTYLKRSRKGGRR